LEAKVGWMLDSSPYSHALCQLQLLRLQRERGAWKEAEEEVKAFEEELNKLRLQVQLKLYRTCE
jgi:hypothetical protein